MAIHHLTPPIRGGERPRLPSTQIGPVTQAIRAMRAAEPIKTANFADLPLNIEEIRLEIANRIQTYIDILDVLDGDCDIEEDDPPGGDVCDEPHDPEEDAGVNEPESAAYLHAFNGYSYAPVGRDA